MRMACPGVLCIALDVPRNHQVVQQMPSMPCPKIKSLQVLNSFNLGSVNLNHSHDTESLSGNTSHKMDVKCGACTDAASAGADARAKRWRLRCAFA